MIALPRNLRKRTLLIMLRERWKWDGNSAPRLPRIEQWRASCFLPEDLAMFRVCLPLAALVLAALANPHSIQADDPQPGQVLLTIRGHLLPANTVTVSPRVAGQISKINFEEGQRVRAGDVLARLDSAKLEVALRRAQAELNMAEAELIKTKEGGGRLDTQIAQAKVDVARTQVALAQVNLDGTTITAPIDGTILTKRAGVGTTIDPQAARAPTSLCDIADLRHMEVEIWVPERDLARAAKGNACTIKVDALPNETFRGKVVRTLPVADKAKAAVGVRISIDESDKNTWLLPGLSAIVEINKP
jgi:RND family efflux transporter MFP subunit